MNKNIINTFTQSGLIYKTTVECEKYIKKDLASFWKLYLVKELIKLRGYSLKNKIDVIIKKEDPKNKLVEKVFNFKYKVLEDHFKHSKLSKYISFPRKFSKKEDLRCLYSIISEIFTSDIYQVKKLIYESDHIIDGGANIGLFSYYVKILYPKTQLYVFEPENTNFKIAKRNLNRFNKIKYFHKALGEKNIDKTLNVSKKMMLHYIDDLNVENDLEKNSHSTQRIKLVSIDNIRFTKLDIIKLDIEGYEYQALFGASKSIKKFSPLILVAIEHAKEQSNKITKLINTINPKYKKIKLNSDILCFYLKNKHRNRIIKLNQNYEN